MKKRLHTLLAGIAIASATFAQDYSLPFSYVSPESETTVWGTAKKETYDIAIHVTAPGLEGKKITGLRVATPAGAGMTDCEGWISTELKLESGKNAADITSQTASFEENLLYVNFDTPYTITADGVYVGYSFTIPEVENDAAKYPVTVCDGKNTEGLYIHSSRTYRKWAEKSSAFGMISAMQVMLEGEFPAVGVALSASDLIVGAASETNLPINISNVGLSPVKTLTFSWAFGDAAVYNESEFEFETELPAVCGLIKKAYVAVKTPDTVGKNTLRLQVTAINGQPVSTPAVEMPVEVKSFYPVKRSLMEEFTGLWCGWCPRGFIALEEMARLYPDTMIGVSYHQGGGSYEPMECLTEYPYNPTGFPSAYVNRQYDVDPYYGDGSTELGILPFLQDLNESFAMAGIEVDLDWADEAHTMLKATSHVRFVDDCSGDYRVSYMLVADGLTGPTDPKDPKFSDWLQSNYYSGGVYLEGEGSEVFTEGGSVVPGLKFNFVVIHYDDQNGVEGSLPAELRSGVVNSHEYIFDLSEVTNVQGEAIIQDPGKLHCVAVLTDAATGEYINCANSGYPGNSGVNAPSASDATVVGEVFHDMTGRRISSDSRGLMIHTVIMSDGTRRSAKVMRR